MAMDVTVNLDDTREEALQRMTTTYNTRSGESLTSAQFLRRHVRNEWIDAEVRRHEAEQAKAETGVALGMRQIYRMGTTAEQAEIDAVLETIRARIQG